VKFAVQPSVNLVHDARRAEILANPAFGRVFTDHMISCVWSKSSGWQDASLTAYGPISVDPASVALHYGQTVFEGLKAYRQPDGGVALFRPERNAARMARSCRRLALPEFPEDAFVEACELLVRQDAAWVPEGEGASLYLRPFVWATEVGLGVRPSEEALFQLIASPAGNYFSGPLRPVSLWLSQEYVRAAPGGTGAAKCGGH
jgi:branched-chain amino acid aminotransferase